MANIKIINGDSLEVLKNMDDDYIRLCKSCHATFDGVVNNFRNGGDTL